MSTITPALENELAWDQLEMARADHKVKPNQETYAELLSCLAALASVIRKNGPEIGACPAPEEYSGLGINIGENTARVEALCATATESTPTTGWIILRSTSDGYTLAFHPESQEWMLPEDREKDLKECLLASIEDADLALDFSKTITPDDETAPRLAEMDILPGRIVEKKG
jgi:hypothetical protein